MAKRNKKAIVNDYSSSELTREKAKELLKLHFSDSYFVLSAHVGMSARYINDCLNRKRPFNKELQDLILEASLKKEIKRPKIKVS